MKNLIRVCLLCVLATLLSSCASDGIATMDTTTTTTSQTTVAQPSTGPSSMRAMGGGGY